MDNCKITVVDIHDNEIVFEDEDLIISVEGVTTLVVKKVQGGNMDILGSFINVASCVKEYG